jgi:tetratricopeptide (TPR) repeat protein
MKKTILIVLLCTVFTAAFSQDAKFFYDEGLKKAQAGDLEKALENFDKSIELKPDEYVAWYNRAIVKSMMGHFEDALADLEQTIRLNPDYKKAYLNRGTAKRHLTAYTEAIADYTLAIALDSAYAEAYYNRGAVYEMLEHKGSACTDFEKAQALGYKVALQKIAHCKDTVVRKDIHPLLKLTAGSKDFTYGFTSGKPVKVGTGLDGGPANERAYLELLRSPNGKPVKYVRLSSCCAYRSINAPKGLAMLDKYQISYINEKGEEKTELVYLSFYDYDEPQILFGFTTVKY